MLYCFNYSNISIPRVQREIDRAKKDNSFLYYDSDKDIFLDKDDIEVSVSGLSIIPVSGVLQLPKLVNALTKNGALIPNSLEDIHDVEDWYYFIETNRSITPFTGKMLDDDDFLTYIIDYYYGHDQLFLKTKKKDFNGIIKIEDLINPKSDLRKAFSYHLDDEFFLSEKVNIDSDELGNIEYRGFILNNQIMNISRISDCTYHQIPQDVIDYFYEVMETLPNDFPYSYVLDIFSYDSQYDILEFNPIEASGKYLYNSIFYFSNDLTHQDIENVPIEKDRSELTYEVVEHKEPSTIVDHNNTFAKDYSDIQKYDEPINGFFHISGLKPGTKISISELMSNISDENVSSDEDLFGSKQITASNTDNNSSNIDNESLFDEIKSIYMDKLKTNVKKK